MRHPFLLRVFPAVCVFNAALLIGLIASRTTATEKSASVTKVVTTVDSTDKQAVLANDEKLVEPAGPQTASDYAKIGDQFTKKGASEKAVEAYEKSIELAGEGNVDSRIVLIVGRYYYSQKKYKDALRYFSMVSDKNTETVIFKSMLGTALQMTGKNDSAIAILEPLASNQKIPTASRKDMFKVLGDAYRAGNNKDTAVQWYDKYLKSGGIKNADMAFLIASIKEKVVPVKTAVLLYQDNIKRFPDDYRSYLYLGILQSKNKATGDASVTSIKKAISLVDTIASVWFEAGMAYQRLGMMDEAIHAYRNSLKVDSGSINAKKNIGFLLIEKGSAEEAVQCLEGAYKQAPDSLEVMSLLVTAYIRSGKQKEAIGILVKLKAANPTDVTARRQLFDAYQSVGREKEAFEEIKSLLELERDRESLFPYAVLLAKLGKYEEAQMVLEEIVGIVPEDFEALMELASVYRKQNKLDEAVNVYKELCSMDSKFAPALYERAEVHLEQGKVKWAETFYQRALAADPQMALAEIGLAKLAITYNNKDECEIHLVKAEAIAGDDPVVKKEIDKVRNPGKYTAKPAATTEGKDGTDESGSNEGKKKSGKKDKKKQKR